MSVLYVVLVTLAICSPMIVVGGGMVWAYWPSRQPPARDAPLSIDQKPYGDLTACWGCGTELEASRRPRDFQHPLYRRRRHLCGYCEELETIQREKLTSLGQ